MAARCPVSLVTQSVVFPRRYSVARARRWLRKHKLSARKLDRTAHKLRFRQLDPRQTCAAGNFATIPMGQTGIQKILCCPKSKPRR
jgi:hypothetical protein